MCFSLVSDHRYGRILTLTCLCSERLHLCLFSQCREKEKLLSRFHSCGSQHQQRVQTFFFPSFNQRIWGKQSWVWRYLKVRGRKKEPILRNLSQTKQIISATVSLPYFSGGKKVCKVSFYEVLSAIVCVSPLRNHIWPVKLHFYHVQSNSCTVKHPRFTKGRRCQVFTFSSCSLRLIWFKVLFPTFIKPYWPKMVAFDNIKAELSTCTVD